MSSLNECWFIEFTAEDGHRFLGSSRDTKEEAERVIGEYRAATPEDPTSYRPVKFIRSE